MNRVHGKEEAPRGKCVAFYLSSFLLHRAWFIILVSTCTAQPKSSVPLYEVKIRERYPTRTWSQWHSSPDLRYF